MHGPPVPLGVMLLSSPTEVVLEVDMSTETDVPVQGLLVMRVRSHVKLMILMSSRPYYYPGLISQEVES